MSAREWQPGDVVTATVNGRPNVRLVAGWSKFDPRLRWCELSPRWADGDDEECWFFPGQVTDARPLVVIDAEDREQVERLWVTLRDGLALRSRDNMQAALREFANPTPPRIDEPGTWGVVEAACPHDDRRRQWVRHPDGNWWPALDYSTVPERTPLPDDWSDLIDPALIREGVTP